MNRNTELESKYKISTFFFRHTAHKSQLRLYIHFHGIQTAKNKNQLSLSYFPYIFSVIYQRFEQN